MAFGFREPKHIADPLCEPMWTGRRVLVDVAGPDVEIRDETGEVLEGYDEVRTAVIQSSFAAELVLDGYLVRAPLRGTVGAEAPVGLDAVMSPGEIGRQMLLGGGGRNARRDALEVAEARSEAVPATSPAAFVAVDLLWLDGESLLDVPLLERKRLLESVLGEHELIRRTAMVRPPVEAWYAQWKALGFREVAYKAANSRYEPGGTSRDWTLGVIPRR
jgi:hypothetical protein